VGELLESGGAGQNWPNGLQHFSGVPWCLGWLEKGGLPVAECAACPYNLTCDDYVGFPKHAPPP